MPDLPSNDNLEHWEESDVKSIKLEVNRCKHDWEVYPDLREIVCTECEIVLTFNMSMVDEAKGVIKYGNLRIPF